MKIATAKLNYLHMTPRKVRLVASSLQGLSIQEAEAQLLLRNKMASLPLLKLLRSGIANAKNNKLTLEKLFVSSLQVNSGPMLKRGLPRAMGRVTPIQKKTSHVTLVLGEGDKIYPMRYNIVTAKKDKKIKKPKKTIKTETPSKEQKEKKQSKSDERTHVHQAEPGFFKRVFRRKSV